MLICQSVNGQFLELRNMPFGEYCREALERKCGGSEWPEVPQINSSHSSGRCFLKQSRSLLGKALTNAVLRSHPDTLFARDLRPRRPCCRSVAIRGRLDDYLRPPKTFALGARRLQAGLGRAATAEEDLLRREIKDSCPEREPEFDLALHTGMQLNFVARTALLKLRQRGDGIGHVCPRARSKTA